MVLLRTFLVFFLLAFPAAAATVQSVADDGTITLDDGQAVHLYGITNVTVGDVRTLLMGVAVTVEPLLTDRHGHLNARLVMADKQSAQAKLVAAGQAQVFTMPDTAAIAVELLPLEKAARVAKQGYWGDNDFRIFTPDDAQYAIGQFAIVEGKVIAVAVVQGTTYVNFGTDWRTDFTAALPSRLAKSMNAKAWAGQVIRVRGWVQPKNGAYVTVTHSEQVEGILLPPPKAATKDKKPKKEKKPRKRKAKKKMAEG